MKEIMPILALDPATKMGWALSPLLSGVWDLSLKRDESMGMKFLRCRSKLNELLDNYRIQLVVYEAARHAAPKMQGALVHQAQLQAIIIDWATAAGIDSKGYSPKEIKKWATGNGNASKEIMLALAKKRWPEIPIVDDNQADALLLWQMATVEFKFLINGASGKLIAANRPPPALETLPPVAEISAPVQPGLDIQRLVRIRAAKVRRAFRRIGRAEAPEEEKRAFLVRLEEANIPVGQISSFRLAKVLKGELTLENLKKLIERRKEA